MNGDIARLASVLVVDDSAVQRAHLVGLCQGLGIPVVHEASDGAQALALLERLPVAPDVMLIDLEMPVMDGIELIQHLQARRLKNPVVVVSERETGLVTTVVKMARTNGLQVTRARTKHLASDELRELLATSLAPAERSAEGSLGTPVAPEQLARAIASGRVLPHFQPKADTRTGLIRGLEVLARWTDDEIGPVTPDRFIPVAEEHGLIHALTLSLLDQSLARAAWWRARGFSPTLAFNLSPGLLGASSLVSEIGHVVQRHGHRPEQLTLEITESSVISYRGVALGTLARLRMQGYGLSIDDYGTGFSSMQQLSHIPFTELKIDRSFVNGAHANESLRVMLQSSIEMARQLRLTSVAEGVETPQDWALLRSYGCDLVQGWLIGRAMPGDVFPGWLKEHQTRLASLRAVEPPTNTEPR